MDFARRNHRVTLKVQLDEISIILLLFRESPGDLRKLGITYK